MTNKPRIVKDYEKLTPEIQEQIKLSYPFGFARHLIQYKNADGKFVSALPFETDDRYYLVRMTLMEAKQIIEDDDDYDESGELKESVREEYEEKYGDLDYLTITEAEVETDEDMQDDGIEDGPDDNPDDDFDDDDDDPGDDDDDDGDD